MCPWWLSSVRSGWPNRVHGERAAATGLTAGSTIGRNRDSARRTNDDGTASTRSLVARSPSRPLTTQHAEPESSPAGTTAQHRRATQSVDRSRRRDRTGTHVEVRVPARAGSVTVLISNIAPLPKQRLGQQRRVAGRFRALDRYFARGHSQPRAALRGPPWSYTRSGTEAFLGSSIRG